jgi:hypothetical protein
VDVQEKVTSEGVLQEWPIHSFGLSLSAEPMLTRIYTFFFMQKISCDREV